MSRHQSARQKLESGNYSKIDETRREAESQRKEEYRGKSLSPAEHTKLEKYGEVMRAKAQRALENGGQYYGSSISQHALDLMEEHEFTDKEKKNTVATFFNGGYGSDRIKPEASQLKFLERAIEEHYAENLKDISHADLSVAVGNRVSLLKAGKDIRRRIVSASRNVTKAQSDFEDGLQTTVEETLKRRYSAANDVPRQVLSYKGGINGGRHPGRRAIREVALGLTGRGRYANSPVIQEKRFETTVNKFQQFMGLSEYRHYRGQAEAGNLSGLHRGKLISFLATYGHANRNEAKRIAGGLSLDKAASENVVVDYARKGAILLAERYSEHGDSRALEKLGKEVDAASLGFTPPEIAKMTHPSPDVDLAPGDGSKRRVERRIEQRLKKAREDFRRSGSGTAVVQNEPREDRAKFASLDTKPSFDMGLLNRKQSKWANSLDNFLGKKSEAEAVGRVLDFHQKGKTSAAELDQIAKIARQNGNDKLAEVLENALTKLPTEGRYA